MKNLTFIGIILLAIGLLLFYLNNYMWDLRVVYGALSGVGVGLIIGGVVGYFSKGNAIKAEQKRKEFKQLQQEKIEFEKQQQKNEEAVTNSSITNSNDINY